MVTFRCINSPIVFRGNPLSITINAKLMQIVSRRRITKLLLVSLFLIALSACTATTADKDALLPVKPIIYAEDMVRLDMIEWECIASAGNFHALKRLRENLEGKAVVGVATLESIKRMPWGEDNPNERPLVAHFGRRPPTGDNHLRTTISNIRMDEKLASNLTVGKEYLIAGYMRLGRFAEVCGTARDHLSREYKRLHIFVENASFEVRDVAQ